jgi:hypothetical protein
MNGGNNGNGTTRGIGSLTNAKFSSFINREQTILPPGPSAIKDVDKDKGNNDSSNFELWTFRVPSEMNIKDLHGVELVLNGDNNNKSTIQQINDKFTLKQGESVENHNFRVLVPGSNGSGKNNDDNSSSSSSSDDDDDDDDDDEKKDKTTNTTAQKYLLHPSSKTFTRHFNVNSALYTKKTEMELAPRNGPKPSFENDGTKLRHAYSSIPQRTGMKRRWMPLGVPKTKAKEIPVSLMENISTKNDNKNATTITSDDDYDSNNNDVKRSKTTNASSSSSKKKKGDSSGKKRKSASGNGRNDKTITSTTSPSPKTKRIKSEQTKNSSSKNSNIISTPSPASSPSPSSSMGGSTSSLTKKERKSAKKAAKKEAKKLEKTAKKSAKKSAKKMKKEQKQEELSV